MAICIAKKAYSLGSALTWKFYLNFVRIILLRNYMTFCVGRTEDRHNHVFGTGINYLVPCDPTSVGLVLVSVL